MNSLDMSDLLNKEYNELDTKESIITEDGLFYSNFSDRFRLVLATIEASDKYSEYLVWLRDTYGIKIGKPYHSNGTISENDREIGVYIVDYQRYLSDRQRKLDELNNENGKSLK